MKLELTARERSLLLTTLQNGTFSGKILLEIAILMQRLAELEEEEEPEQEAE